METALKQHLGAAARPAMGWGSTNKDTRVSCCPYHRLGRAGQQLSPSTEAGDHLGRKDQAGLASSSSSRSRRLMPDPEQRGWRKRCKAEAEGTGNVAAVL